MESKSYMFIFLLFTTSFFTSSGYLEMEILADSFLVPGLNSDWEKKHVPEYQYATDFQPHLELDIDWAILKHEYYLI